MEKKLKSLGNVNGSTQSPKNHLDPIQFLILWQKNCPKD